MRIGEAKYYEKEEHSLYEWTSQSGFGIIGYCGRDQLPQKCIDYCMSAFPFFGLSNHPTLEEVARIGAFCTYWVIDIGNPYALFMGVSDVDYTEDWQKYTFEIKDPYRDRIIEANPELLETYRWVPGQAEREYTEILRRGGEWFEQWRRQKEANFSSILDTLPIGIGSEIQCHLDGDWGESAHEQLDDHVVLKKLHEVSGGDVKLQMTYFEVAAWAAFLWMAGPEGRDWRNCHHDIFHMCANDGVAFMYDQNFVEKENVVAMSRPPQSCVVCGLDSYCVEMAHISGVTRYICEKHLNDEPVFEGATCGAKICRAVICPHHPLHGRDNGLMEQLKKTGQLTSRREDQMLLGVQSGPKLIGN